MVCLASSLKEILQFEREREIAREIDDDEGEIFENDDDDNDDDDEGELFEKGKVGR